MTKQQYLDLRKHNKELGKKLGVSKRLSRSFESRIAKYRNTCSVPEFMKDKDSGLAEIYTEQREEQEKGNLDFPYFEFRSNHIFLSMCRGKTLARIEPNRDTSNGDTLIVNKRIEMLCKKYEIEFVTLIGFISQVKRHWLEKEVA